MRMAECREWRRLSQTDTGAGQLISEASEMPADDETNKFDAAVSSSALTEELNSGVVSSSTISQLSSLSAKASTDFVDCEDPIVDP